MKLKRLSLRSLPGLQKSFVDLKEIHPGLNIIIGPNASGKTSLCKAVRALLWPQKDLEPWASAKIFSEWTLRQESFTIALENGMQVVSEGGKLAVERLPEKYLASCFTITIDDLFASKDETFIQKISTEIAGGCDVEAVRQSIEESGHSAKSAISAWNEARGALEKHRKEQDALRQEEGALPALEKKIQKAKEAKDSSSMLEKMIEAKKVQEEILQTKSKLDTFPNPFKTSKIQSADWDLYQALEKQQRELEEEIATIQKEISHRQSVALKVSVSELELDLQLKRIDRMELFQRNLDQSPLKKLTAEVAQHRRLLGIVSDEEIEKINSSFLNAIEELWQNVELLEHEISAIQEQIRLHQGEETLSSSTAENASFLLSELSACPEGAFSKEDWVFCGIALVSSAALLFALPGTMRLFALFPLFSIAALWLRKKQSRERKEELVRRYKKLAPLEETDPLTIKERFKYSLKQWSEALQKDLQRQRKQDLETQLQEKRNKKVCEKERLLEQARKAGIETLPEKRLHFIKMLKDLHEAWVAMDQARLEAQKNQTGLEEEWNVWNPFASLFDLKISSNVFDLRTIHSKMRDRRNEDLKLENAKTSLAKQQQTLLARVTDGKKILERAACEGDPDRLKAWVDLLPSYEDALRDLKQQEKTLEKLKSEIGSKRAERLRENLDIFEEERRLELEAAETLEALLDKRAELRSRLKQAESADLGESLLSKQEKALKGVAVSARKWASKEFALFLMEEAQKDFERKSQPQVLQKAMDWFQRFTKNKFTLEAPTTRKGQIVYEAIDTSFRDRRSLDELSRGTRMQLLMAVRLAFTLHHEKKGDPLPIFLDEVLANTDPERFDAIAEVVGELVHSGFQVFYLTCNPEDVWKWKQRCPETHVIDLAKEQGKQAFLTAPLPQRQEETGIQQPLGQSFESYVQELKLPGIRFDAPIDQVPIHYFVDCSDDLFHLLSSRIEVYGNLKAVKPEIFAKRFPTAMPLVARRKELLEKVFALKTQGRGKSLSRSVFIEGGLSEGFLEPLSTLAEELGGDAKKFVEGIEAKRIKRFRMDERWESFKFFLEEKGFFDPREVLSDDAIRYELLVEMSEEADRRFIEGCIHAAQ